MLQKAASTFPARRFSLSAYISFLLIAIALLTLLAAIGSIFLFLRPALIAQTSSNMETDVKTHVQLVDTYLSERLNDVETLSQTTPLKNLLNGMPNSQASASDVLFTTFHRDVAGYISLALFNAQGNVVLSYPTAPQRHGKYLIQPEALQQLQMSTKVAVSDVFYDPVANNPSVDLYARVLTDNFQTLGTIRASLSLHRLWEPVDSEPQTNGADSFAFVLDQHGVRIAYTNPDHSGFTRPQYLFKAVAPLSTPFQQSIIDENLYGNDVTPVTSFNDNTLASMQNNTQASPIFQFDAAGQGQTFVAARYTSTVVPWTYYLLKPLTTVTGLADQQLLSVFLIVSIVLLLAVVIGVLAGRRIAITQNERGCCMQHIYKRREAIKIGLGSLAGLSTLGLVSCSSTEDAISPNQGNVAMNLVFWGTATRNTATRQAISLFQQRYANVSIASSTPRLTITGPCSINWLLPVRHRNSCRWTCGMLPDMPEAN